MKKVEDLTGRRFGKLIVVGRAEKDKMYKNIRRTTWLCKCDCGNTIDVITSNLLGNTVKSCGCGKSKINDLAGQTFGNLTVLRRADEDKTYGTKKVATWLCECSCGNRINVVGNNLKRGLTKSCMACAKMGEDLSGKRFGRLTVIKRADKVKYGNKSYNAWLCKCDCGKETVVIGNSLKTGNTTSCGCKFNEYLENRWKAKKGKQ